MNFREIAKQAGVSITTVSRVYNGKTGVGRSTRLKIENLLKESLYYGSLAKKAANSESQSMKIITFVIYESEHYILERNEEFFSKILIGAEKKANESGFLLNIVRLDYRDLSDLIINSKNVSGLIILAADISFEQCEILEKSNIPVVVVDNSIAYSSVNSISADNTYGTYKAVSYLKELGHKEIGLLTSRIPMDGLSKREKNFYEVMDLLRLNVDPGHIVKLDHIFDAGVAQMDKYLSFNNDLPTAFFAVNDTIAAEAIHSLKQHGYRIPEDISIIGFDDANIGNFSEPRITSMKIDCRKLGELALNRIVEIQKGDKSILHTYIDTPLIIKESTAKRNEK